MKVECEYDMKKGCRGRRVCFWKNEGFVVGLNDGDVRGDDGYVMIRRYVGYIGKDGWLGCYERLVDDKGYGKIWFFGDVD